MQDLNPSNAEATLDQSTRLQRFLKTILILSYKHSLDSSARVLSNEYPCCRDSIIFQVLSHRFVLAKIATSLVGHFPESLYQ